jgi:hypothetical protein
MVNPFVLLLSPLLEVVAVVTHSTPLSDLLAHSSTVSTNPSAVVVQLEIQMMNASLVAQMSASPHQSILIVMCQVVARQRKWRWMKLDVLFAAEAPQHMMVVGLVDHADQDSVDNASRCEMNMVTCLCRVDRERLLRSWMPR